MLQIKKFMLSTVLLALGLSVPAQASTIFGKPVSIETGKCKTGDAQWELSLYDNGWYMAKGPVGFVIGMNPRLLIASVCGHKFA